MQPFSSPLRSGPDPQHKEWMKGVEFVEHFAEIGGGEGGYNNDHEFFGYSQSI